MSVLRAFYEGATAMAYFRVHGPFRPGVEDRVVRTVRRLMDLCPGEKRLRMGPQMRSGHRGRPGVTAGR